VFLDNQGVEANRQHPTVEPGIASGGLAVVVVVVVVVVDGLLIVSLREHHCLMALALAVQAISLSRRSRYPYRSPVRVQYIDHSQAKSDFNKKRPMA
jgi:hypothetical protein